MSKQPDECWPAHLLEEELRALYRTWMRDAFRVDLRGRDSWPNLQPESFIKEETAAKKLGVVPQRPGDAGFEELIRSGMRFNWAVSLDGSVAVSPSVVKAGNTPRRISHAILVPGGGDTLAAGEGQYPEYLSHTTGHYKNEDFILLPVKRAFDKIGFVFKR